MNGDLSPGDLVGCTPDSIGAFSFTSPEGFDPPPAWRMRRGQLGLVLTVHRRQVLVLSLGRVGWITDLWLEAL